MTFYEFIKIGLIAGGLFQTLEATRQDASGLSEGLGSAGRSFALTQLNRKFTPFPVLVSLVLYKVL